jgi:hypothetical protein
MHAELCEIGVKLPPNHEKSLPFCFMRTCVLLKFSTKFPAYEMFVTCLTLNYLCTYFQPNCNSPIENACPWCEQSIATHFSAFPIGFVVIPTSTDFVTLLTISYWKE